MENFENLYNEAIRNDPSTFRENIKHKKCEPRKALKSKFISLPLLEVSTGIYQGHKQTE